MTYQEMFETVKGMTKDADVSGIKEHLAFQFHIVGDGEGIFYIEIVDGGFSIEPYDYYSHDAQLEMTAATLVGILEGKVDLAKVIGTEVAVDGDVEKALLLQKFVVKKTKTTAVKKKTTTAAKKTTTTAAKKTTTAAAKKTTTAAKKTTTAAAKKTTTAAAKKTTTAAKKTTAKKPTVKKEAAVVS